MTKAEFRSLMAECQVSWDILADLSGRSRHHLQTVGTRSAVGRHLVSLCKAWYLMDGPTRDRLLREVERI